MQVHVYGVFPPPFSHGSSNADAVFKKIGSSYVLSWKRQWTATRLSNGKGGFFIMTKADGLDSGARM